MTTWQAALQLVQTLGLGSLLGVLVGIGATRSQKRRETLQAIKSSNYREVVQEYRLLNAQLIRILDSARLGISRAQIYLNMTEDSVELEDRVKSHIESKIADASTDYEEAIDGLSEKIAALLVHRGETPFHSQINAIEMLCGQMNIELSILSIFGPTHEHFNSATEVASRLEGAIGTLRLIWDNWKVEAEREASGLRPIPMVGKRKMHLNRRL